MINDPFPGRDLHKFARDMIGQVMTVRVFPEEQEAMIEAVVQQWRTLNGHAVLFTADERIWLKLTPQPNGNITVSASHYPGNMIEPYVHQRDIDPASMPELIRGLNEQGSVEIANRRGERFRLWVKPAEGTLGIEELGADSS